jgi:hypothetical protein
MEPPLVIVLDLDGTIIGDIRHQITTYDIHTKIKSDGGKLQYNFKDYKSKLKGGIVRPFFCEFLRRLKQDIPSIEFFVYTASEQKWAIHIINQIEKTCSVKFNRPLFTRNDCIVAKSVFTKSLDKIKPRIAKTLKSKYGPVNLENRILIVDNTDIFVKEDQPYQILCETYNFEYPENIGAIINHADYTKHHHIINRVLAEHLGIFLVGSNYLNFQDKFYRYYSSVLGKAMPTNKEFTRDTFYKNLRRAIVKLVVVRKHGKFDVNGVSYIRRQLAKAKHK